jgi:hypothetical protein
MHDGTDTLTRRRFSLTLGGAALSLSGLPLSAAEDMPWAAPAMVTKVYLAVPRPTWPRPDLDVKQEIAGIEARLAELQRKHAGQVQLTGGDLLRTPEDVGRWAAGLGDADAILVIDLTSSTASLLQAMAKIDTPMLLFTRPYAGWSYLNFASWLQEGKKADLVASSDFGDLDPYMRAFRSIHHLRKSTVLAVTPSQGARKLAGGYTTQFGTTIRFVSYQDLAAAYEAADPRQAQEAAGEFTRGALRVVEPSQGDIRDALRFYQAVVALLRKEKANAITIDCLGGFRRGELPAYPCVAWSKLNNQGLYGVCEADLPSTMTQLLVTSSCGKPGFVSDPVFDTSRNEIIHAHCVSATALQGVGGPPCPYAIRSHMEDNKGVSMQVMVPVAETVTVGKFADPKTFLVSTGEVIGNIESQRGCRTQFRTRVANARKMLEGYRAGLHRVVFFGDYVGQIERLGRLAGFKVIHEA